MSLLILTVFILVSVSHNMNAAPTSWESVADNNPYQQSELEKILKASLFNSTDNLNFYIIKKVFQPRQGTHKICNLIAFNITFADQCSDIYKEVLWTEYSTADIAGRILLYFAATNGSTVFGFDWADACNIPDFASGKHNKTLPTLNLVLPSHICNDTTGIYQTLFYLTTLMPYYATLSDIPSSTTFFDDKIMGYAVDFEEVDYDYDAIFFLYAASILLIITSGLSTPLFFTISKSIETTDKGKPKLYYHFWSSMVLTVVGIWGYAVIHHVNTTQNYFSLLSMIMWSHCGMVIAIILNIIIHGGDIFFLAPLSEFCCNNRCRTVWSCLMTFIGFFISLTLIIYFICAIPTIVLVYYLYPVRTLIRVPFIISVVFNTITMLSLVLYHFEKVYWAIRFYIKYGDDLPLHTQSVNSFNYGSWRDIDDLESAETRTRSRNLRVSARDIDNCYTCWQCNAKKIALQHELNKQHYLKVLQEDFKSTEISGCLLLLSFPQLLVVIVICGTFIFGEIVMAQLVFKQTNDTNINSLLGPILTMIFSIFAWFGHSLILDVRKDIKNLSIPCMKKDESQIEEKMLQEITAVKEELQRVIRISVETGRTGRVKKNDRATDSEVSERENEDGVVMVEIHGSTNEENSGQNDILVETPKLCLAAP